MATRKQQKDENDKVGTNESDEFKTIPEGDVADEVPTSAEKRDPEKVDAEGAADGEVVGGVVDGESNAFDEDRGDDEDYDFPVDDDGVAGATGTVAEKDIHGDEYDVPYVIVSAADLEPVRTSDTDDNGRDWTAQHAAGEREDEDGNKLDPVALVPVENTPGQTFRVGELPNRDVAEAAGINYDQFIAGLPVRADVPDEAPRRGIPA